MGISVVFSKLFSKDNATTCGRGGNHIFHVDVLFAKLMVASSLRKASKFNLSNKCRHYTKSVKSVLIDPLIDY